MFTVTLVSWLAVGIIVGYVGTMYLFFVQYFEIPDFFMGKIPEISENVNSIIKISITIY